MVGLTKCEITNINLYANINEIIGFYYKFYINTKYSVIFYGFPLNFHITKEAGPLKRLFSSRSFLLNVYHRTKFSCISGHLIENTQWFILNAHTSHLSDLFVVSFDVIIINYKSNLL